MDPHFVVEQTPKGYSWRLLSSEDRVIAVSGTHYPTLDECIDAIEVVRRSHRAAVREGRPR